MIAPYYPDLRKIPASKNSFKRIIRKQIISTYNVSLNFKKKNSLFGISSGAPYQSGEYSIDGASYQSGEHNIDGAPYQSGEHNIDGAPYQSGEHNINDAPYQSGEHNIDGAPYQSGEYIISFLFIKVM